MDGSLAPAASSTVPGGQGGSWCLAVLRWQAGARDGAEIKEASLRWLEAGYRAAHDPPTNLVEEMGLFSFREGLSEV